MNGELSPEAPAGAEFPFITYPPQVQFATTRIPPPAPAYVSPDDLIIVDLRSSVAGLQVITTIRLLLPDGSIKMIAFLDTPTADRAANRRYIRLPEGFVVGMVVNCSVNAKPGALYARVYLIRGGETYSDLCQLLVCGYVISGAGLTWPTPRHTYPVEGPGRLRRITGTDPVPGQNPREVVPTGARWRLMSYFVIFTTAAAAANRQLYLLLDDGATAFYFGEGKYTQTASKTVYYTWAQGLENPAAASTLWVNMPLPIDMWLPAGYGITAGVIAFQPADDFSAPEIWVEEWIEP